MKGAVILPHGNLIVGARAVVGPGCLLHDAASDGLEIHEIVALLEDRHPLYPLLTLLLGWIVLLLLLFHCAHVHLAEMLGLVEILVERVWRVDRLKLFRCILAGIFEYDLWPSRVLREELGDIVGFTMYNHPARFVAVVLCNLLTRELLARVLRFSIHFEERRLLNIEGKE